MSSPNLIRAAAISAVLGACAGPATAHAAVTATELKPCYLSAMTGDTEGIDVRASGFTPSALVDVTVAGRPLPEPVRADATGSVQAVGSAPFERHGERAFVVRLSERGNAANTLSLRSRVSAIDVDVRPHRARPNRKVRWLGRGFAAKRPVYAHYVYGGKARKTVRLGFAGGACGTFAVRRKQFPFRPAVGSWLVQVDQQRKYSVAPEASAVVRLRVDVHSLSG